MNSYLHKTIIAAVLVFLSGCGGPSCEDLGGKMKLSHIQFYPMKIGSTTLMQQQPIYVCEMPDNIHQNPDLVPQQE